MTMWLLFCQKTMDGAQDGSVQFVEDKIWGFWPEDEKTSIIGKNMD